MDGTVLLGGDGDPAVPSAIAELFGPATMSFSPAGPVADEYWAS